MNTKKAPWIRLSRLGIGLVAMTTPAFLHAATFTWNSSATSGTETDWFNSSSWLSGGSATTATPGSLVTNDTVTIGTVGVVNFDSAAADVSIRSLVLTSSPSGNTATMNIKSGSLTTGLGVTLSSTTAGNAIINQSGGTFTIGSPGTVAGLNFGASGSDRQGFYNLSGGNLTTNVAVNLGSGGNGYITQTGGNATFANKFSIAITSSNGSISAANEGVYSISGGTASFQDVINGDWAASTAKGIVTGKFEVVGSSATIAINGNYSTGLQDTTVSTFNGDPGIRTSILSVKIDNGGLSKINMAATKTAGLDGVLQAGVKGGMALTSTDSFTIFEADTGLISTTTAFDTSVTSTLFGNATVSAISGSRDALVIAFDASAQVDSLAPVRTGAIDDITFTGTGVGYVELTGLQSGDDLTVFAAATAGTGKSISDLVTFLTDAGLVASTTTEVGYDLALSFTSVSGTSFLSWDLSEFNADAQISGLGFMVTAASVPEPSTCALLLGIAGLGLAVTRRRR